MEIRVIDNRGIKTTGRYCKWRLSDTLSRLVLITCIYASSSFVPFRPKNAPVDLEKQTDTVLPCFNSFEQMAEQNQKTKSWMGRKSVSKGWCKKRIDLIMFGVNETSCHSCGSNTVPPDLQSGALPIELEQLVVNTL